MHLAALRSAASSSVDPQVLEYSNVPNLLAQTIPFFSLAAIVVAGRCYVRAVMLRAFGKDDWAIVLAMIFSVACFTCYMIEISCGAGKHVAFIRSTPQNYRTFLMARQIHMITVMTGISLVKISVSFLLLRLAIRRLYVWFLWGMIIFMVAFTLACVFQCIPIAAIWDMSLRPPPIGTGHARCLSVKTFSNIGLFNAVINITTDLLLAFLPTPLIWRLHINLRARVSLVAVLSLGIFASVAAIVKQHNAHQFRNPEPYIADAYSIWNFIELDIGIIAASLPALKPLFSWFYATARGLPRLTKGSGFGSDPVRGSEKRSAFADVVLEEYNSRPSGSGRCKIKITSSTSMGSEESILSPEQRSGASNTIMVKSEVHVE